MSKTALITGASVGIGYEFCKLFASDGYDLVLVARNQEKLETLAQELSSKFEIKTQVIAKDLAKPDAAQTLFDEVEKQGIKIDALINNAGIGSNGRFAELDLQSELNMIQLNVTSLVSLCHLFSQGMIERKSGAILNVASTAAFQPGPKMANYYASKAYVLSFSEALHQEMKHKGVKVSALCPGATATEFFNAAKMTDSILAKSPLIMSAQQVAKIGYQALNKNKAVAVSGWANWLMAQSVRFTPRAVIRQFVARLNG